jgi:hypothetical protein
VASFADVIRNAVATIRQGPAGELRVTVVHVPITGRDGDGPTFGTPEPELAIVEDVAEEDKGVAPVSRAKLTFLEPVEIQENDIFYLLQAGGSQTRAYRVLRHAGVKDPLTNGTYMTEVWLGN